MSNYSELSPIERLIDQACGHTPTARRLPTPAEKEAARVAACKVLQHIDEMYPRMWQGVPKLARVSLRNEIIAQITALLTSLGRQ